MATILSTKKLLPENHSRLIYNKLKVIEEDFISIIPIPFSIPAFDFNQIQHIIITSQNSVDLVANHLLPYKGKLQFYVVGKKTSSMLENLFSRESIFMVADYGSDLAERITGMSEIPSFTFFCGKQRRNDIPDTLTKHNVSYKEFQVYDTIPNPVEINEPYNAVLFFSPSAVESFVMKNDISQSSAIFAIGNTTANAIKKYYNGQVNLPAETTERATVLKTIEHFNKI